VSAKKNGTGVILNAQSSLDSKSTRIPAPVSQLIVNQKSAQLTLTGALRLATAEILMTWIMMSLWNANRTCSAHQELSSTTLPAHVKRAMMFATYSALNS